MLRLIKKNTIMYYYKTYKDNNGYPRFKTTNILVHRLVASKKLGRDLLPGEIVHHINRNKSDNRPSNLCIFIFSSRRRHTRLVSAWSSDVCSSDLRAHVFFSSRRRHTRLVSDWSSDVCS